MRGRTLVAGLVGAASLCVSGLSSASALDSAATTPTGASSAAGWTYRGVTVVPQSHTDLGTKAFQDSVREAALDGSNTIGIVVQYYQKSLTSSRIYDAPTTPTMKSLTSAINFVHSQGLKVMLKVFYDAQPPKGSYTSPWRYFINPKNRTEWFKDATAREVALGRLHPDLLVLGTEMGDLSSQKVNRQNGPDWRALIKSVRQVDPNALTYEAQTPSNGTGAEAQHIAFWPELDYIGLSAYTGLQVPCDASVAQLSSAWQADYTKHYQPLEADFQKPLLLGEAGYSSYTCDHQRPYAYHGSAPASKVDLSEQSNDYDALLSFWSQQTDLAGVMLWNWEPSPSAGGATNSDFTAQNKPAEAIMRNAFAPQTNTVSAWWPTSTYTYTHQEPYSQQTFQAVLANEPLDDYRMYWSVDGGQLNAMVDGTASDGTPEKIGDVDMHTWTWEPSDVYDVTFSAETLGGQEISNTTVPVHFGD